MGEGRDFSDSMEGMEYDIGEDINTMEIAYDLAKSAKVGSMITCPSCGVVFKKKSYQQVFSSNKGRGNCKDRFWNIVPSNRRARTADYLGMNDD